MANSSRESLHRRARKLWYRNVGQTRMSWLERAGHRIFFASSALLIERLMCGSEMLTIKQNGWPAFLGKLDSA